MTNEHLNTQLYWKLQREHTAFKNWLMHQPPGVIIENAYKYAMMEDVLLKMEIKFFRPTQSNRIRWSFSLE